MTTAVDTRSSGIRSVSAESLADRYFSYLGLSDAQLDGELRAMIRAEDELPEPARYEATLERLQAWLELSSEDARIISGAWVRSLATFPPDYARRSAEAERAVVFNGLSFQQFKCLADLLPSLQADWQGEGVEPALIAAAA
jgi:hypothetical protein